MWVGLVIGVVSGSGVKETMGMVLMSLVFVDVMIDGHLYLSRETWWSWS